MINRLKKKNIFLSTFNSIITIVLILLAIVILTQKFSNNEKSFFGLRIFMVRTGSMIPKYNIGDVIIAKEKDRYVIKYATDKDILITTYQLNSF